MDRRIWRKVPVEVLERILSLLPIKTFLSLRPTCKYFRSLIFSPLFISKHTDSPISSFLLLSHPQSPHLLLYDTVSNTWRGSGLPLSRSLAFTPLIASTTCLLCFSSVPDSSNSSFIIHNLLSRSSRILQFPEYPFAFQLLTLLTNPTGYKVFCISSGHSSNNSAYIYDSRSRDWSKHETINRTLGDSYHQQGVLFNGSLYFATREPFLVVSFDMDSGNWKLLDLELPDELTFVRLAAATSGDRLFMFGGIGRNGISKSMKIWELDKSEGEGEMKWDEIESVPELMCRKFGSVCYHNYEHIYCFWHQGMICVCCYTWPEVLYYRVGRRTWHWLPQCPSLPNKWSCGFKWFSFVPELYAAV
ncbi:F-box/kelch-repeat protein At5g43190-like [Bidens hawaiensis]|uniref:F-box/kelch-repeat protein At5g43190-like n=1 Tax=Bidens hawaiensis TaxID=980011 RepID=UPI00404A5A75